MDFARYPAAVSPEGATTARFCRLAGAVSSSVTRRSEVELSGIVSSSTPAAGPAMPNTPAKINVIR